MDEIDSIGMNRGGQQNGGMMMGGMMMGGSGAEHPAQPDGLPGEPRRGPWRYKLLRWFGLVRGPVNDKPLVFVIGATNRPNVLDPR